MNTQKEYKYYDRGHRLDNGAITAYKSGEMPISKWTKKIIVKELTKVVDKANLDRACSMYDLSRDKIKEEIAKMPKEKLIKSLIKTDTHRTGNYFQKTKFYRIPNEIEFVSFVIDCIYKPKEYIQLPLELIY